MIEGLLGKIGDALLLAFGIFWDVGWSLVLGFVLSGLIQALVSQERMRGSREAARWKWSAIP